MKPSGPSVDFAVCLAALIDAADLAGGVDLLARQLHMPMNHLRSWIEGEELAPYSVYLRAVEYVQRAQAETGA